MRDGASHSSRSADSAEPRKFARRIDCDVREGEKAAPARGGRSGRALKAPKREMPT
jgi:hypothetical protein